MKPPSKRGLLIVITDYPGGAERVTFGLAAELASRPGWQVEVIVVCSQMSDSFSRRVLPPGVHVRYGRARNWFLSFPLLPFRLLFRRYDLVFTTHVYTNALLSAMRRCRLIRVSRLVMRESMSLFDRFSGVKARIFSLLYRCYGGEDLLVTQTRYMADHIAARLPAASKARVDTLPNPVDVAAIDAAATEALDGQLERRLKDRINILFCGRFVGFKRPGAALDVFRLLAAESERTQLVFMGAGPLEADIQAEAARAGLSDRVIFLGQRGNPYPVMRACDYGLIPSANEGFPNVALEMMACGMKKIVSTPSAGDLDQLSGVTVTRGFDAAEMAEALRSPIKSGEDCREVYQRVAATRSFPAYLDRLLGVA